jgi:hypothetical protein
MQAQYPLAQFVTERRLRVQPAYGVTMLNQKSKVSRLARSSLSLSWLPEIFTWPPEIASASLVRFRTIWLSVSRVSVMLASA